MICSSSRCPYQKQLLHRDCYQALEDQLIKIMGKCGPARFWTDAEKRWNLWDKKGLALIQQRCGCLCGLGQMRLDVAAAGFLPSEKKLAEGATSVAPCFQAMIQLQQHGLSQNISAAGFAILFQNHRGAAYSGLHYRLNDRPHSFPTSSSNFSLKVETLLERLFVRKSKCVNELDVERGQERLSLQNAIVSDEIYQIALIRRIIIVREVVPGAQLFITIDPVSSSILIHQSPNMKLHKQVHTQPMTIFLADFSHSPTRSEKTQKFTKSSLLPEDQGVNTFCLYMIAAAPVNLFFCENSLHSNHLHTTSLQSTGVRQCKVGTPQRKLAIGQSVICPDEESPEFEQDKKQGKEMDQTCEDSLGEYQLFGRGSLTLGEMLLEKLGLSTTLFF
ncbi:unnamed protein product [Gongylonema pulchrum]|uniref:FERM domain-containing protein n=1 Tax=Gongylonema pulchrum TaxID=637853 RepID=A0A183DS37_9BILA|nr:unnamed protein product [Gongylonema pulchrum]